MKIEENVNAFEAKQITRKSERNVEYLLHCEEGLKHNNIFNDIFLYRCHEKLLNVKLIAGLSKHAISTTSKCKYTCTV